MADLNSEGGYLFTRVAGGGNLREKVSTEHDLNRLTRYAQNWEVYLGQHWTFTREDGEPLITINYARALLDKKIAFLIGQDFTITVPKVLEHITLPVLQHVWEDNGRQALNYEIAQEGHVTGDVFIMITVDAPTYEQRIYDPLVPYRIVIQRLASHECFPKWDETAPPNRYGRPMAEFQIRKEMVRPKAGSRDGQMETVNLIQTVRPNEFRMKIGDDPETVTPNILGEIPVVHLKNQPSSRTYYGLDDMSVLRPLNREINEKCTDVSDIINYNAGPITAIFGAKASKLERSSRALWSGLPETARIEILEMTGDLSAPINYIAQIKKAMHEIAGVPEGSLGQMQPITGTSGETLQQQMAPLMDERNKKKTMYEPAYERVNYFILRYAEAFLNVKMPKMVCRKCGGKIAIFYEPNPITGEVEQRRKCYVLDPETLDFQDPDQMKVPFLRSHSMGSHMTKISMDQADEEVGIKNPSYWDMAPSVQMLPPKKEPAPPPEPPQAQFNPVTGAQIPPQESPAQPEEPEPSPSEELGQPAEALPPGFEYPPEPEEFDLPEINTPEGQIIQSARHVFAVPQECDEHNFLSPYMNYVTFNDTLPKDKQGQATLLQLYLTMGIVSKLWAMQQIGIENPEAMAEQIRQETSEMNAQGAMAPAPMAPAMPPQEAQMAQTPPPGDSGGTDAGIPQ